MTMVVMVMTVIVVWERALLRNSGPGKLPGMCIATSRSPQQLVLIIMANQIDVRPGHPGNSKVIC